MGVGDLWRDGLCPLPNIWDDTEVIPPVGILGGKGIRTPDIQLAKLALYQLSYAPELERQW